MPNVTVLISYARADGKAAADRLREELQRAGFGVWRDIEEMRSGQAWKEQVREALRTVDGVIVLLTPGSFASKHVRWEIEAALTLQKPVKSLLIVSWDKLDGLKGLPDEVINFHHHNLSTEQVYSSGFAALIRDLNELSTGDRNNTPTNQLSQPDGGNSRNISPESNPDEREPLHILELDSGMVEKTNSSLESIERISKENQLSPEQEQTFNDLKARIKLFNRDLEEIAQKAETLIADVEKSLANKLENLSTSAQSILGHYPPERDSNNEKILLEKQLEIIRNLRINLSDGKDVVDWLNQTRSQTAKNITEYALSAHPNLQNRTSLEKENFHLLIEKLLERISHCLTWGRTTILDSLELPLVFNDDIDVYETALNCIIPESPRRLSNEGIKQLEEVITYLIRKLPHY
ncbi:toll/interleukin-1 receptor domain-containing protein [Oculatella sp. LEGE 06141]|uniref:toll/interleukin-1 receptor domain-containing protein n=1 Tax=Oculatella sp. LEGE 06141 TaxID=1828648 RepID=UPI00187EC0BA|nr:toll/interleukin-1 receptor domain-containing protein [Oculatella sp. LEGE 06141]MBE9180431.1 toll/interleukin-1 receptor domain-containing protein [Oculatella sp. LEGE 06141]